MMASFSAKYFFADPVGTDLHQQVLPHPCDIATHLKAKGMNPFPRCRAKAASMIPVPDVNDRRHSRSVNLSCWPERTERAAEREIVGNPEGCRGGHAEAPGTDGLADHHRAVAALIDGILAGGKLRPAPIARRRLRQPQPFGFPKVREPFPS